jgi:FkbM family methyltransferase
LPLSADPKDVYQGSSLSIRSSIHGLLLRLGWEVRRVGYPSSEERLLRRFLAVARPDTVLDVGANAGQYGRSLRVSGFTGRIISFEPIAAVHAKLVREAASDPNWAVAPCGALGRARGEMTINLASNSLSSSLLPMHDIHLKAAPESRFVATERVRIERLDDMVQPLAPTGRLLLKVDTQGYEEEVFAGARAVLERACALQVELSLVPLYESAPTLRRMLEVCEDAGFELHGLVPGFHDAASGRLLQMDGLFLRREASSC